MEQPGGATSLSDFLCTEDRACLDAGDDDPAEPGAAASLSATGGGNEEEEEEEDEGVAFLNDSALSETEQYIGILVSRESAFPSGGGSGGGGDWLRCARSGAIRWILQARAHLRFSLHSAYVSVTYLDRFLLRRTIDVNPDLDPIICVTIFILFLGRRENSSMILTGGWGPVDLQSGQPWVMQLLSVACLSLAAKMEEIRVPPFPEFPAGEYQFDSGAIQRMELLVLNTLEWRMSPVTPFVYLSFFATKLAGDVAGGGEELFYRAVGFIFSTIEEMNLGDFRASAIAAAAIFAAAGKAPTETSMRVISASGSLHIGQVFSCYKTMVQESRSSQSGPGPGGADVGCKRRRDGAD